MKDKPITVQIMRVDVLGTMTHEVTVFGQKPIRSFCFDNLSDALLRVATLLSPHPPEPATGRPRKAVKAKRKKFLLKEAILALLSNGKPRTKTEIILRTKAPIFNRPQQTYGTVLAVMAKHGSLVVEDDTAGGRLYRIPGRTAKADKKAVDRIYHRETHGK